jgi:predicted aminopeptidase
MLSIKNRKGFYRKTFFTIIIILVLSLIWQYENIFYGLSQGYGQLKIILNTKPVQEVLQDNSFPDSLKSKIKLVQEIRRFAFDSLGLNFSDSYTTLYDQKGKPVLWVLTACYPYQLKAKEWSFPFIGSFSYKGFFDIAKARKEENELKINGFDTAVDEVGGWSTLGWFSDPILSEMLNRTPGNLANLIIHELTHGTLYVKNNVDFNENLASFIGDKGALKFLKYKYGASSKEYLNYQKSRTSAQEYTQMVLKYGQKLDSLYKTFTVKDSITIKAQKKKAIILSFKKEFENRFPVSGKSMSRRIKSMEYLNNTYFMDLKRYRENLGIFEREFITRFHSDFSLYISYLKSKYSSL